MEKLIVLVTLVLIAVCLGISDSSASATDANIPDNEASSNLSEANNSSTSATITIRMWTALLADEQVRQRDLVEQQECRTRAF